MSATPLHPLFSSIDGHGSSHGQGMALRACDGERNWRDFASNTRVIASALIANGLVSGDRCAILAGNTAHHVELMFGIARAGGVVIPLSTLLNETTLNSLIVDAEPGWIFVDRKGWKRLGEPDELSRKNRHWKKIVSIDSGIAELTPLGSIIRGISDSHLPEPALNHDFSIIYSSGTTGIPKGIIHSHYVRSLYGLVFSQEYGINNHSVIYLSTLICSNASWMMILAAIYAGATLIIAEGFEPDAFREDVRRYKVSHAFLVPTQLIDLYLNAESSEPEYQPDVIISAGSYLDVGLKVKISHDLGITLYELYGTSEGVCTVLRPWDMAGHADSVGTAITGGEIKIIDPNGHELPDRKVGEIVGISPMISSGYFRCPNLNRDLIWTDPEGRGFIRSGDEGELIDGYLYLRGRQKDMIVSGGLNVYPVDIEAVLRQLPGILDAAVIGVARLKMGRDALRIP